MPPADRQRVDKWLWFARVVKTRTLAQKLVTAGHVRINREKQSDASHPVKIGDTLTISLDSGVRVLRVLAAGVRRGPPGDARLLFEDLSPPPMRAPAPSAGPHSSGRPNKRDRRLLAAFRRRQEEDPSDPGD